MTIIKDDATLRQFLPNAFSIAKGEKTFFDKITPWLFSAENWFFTHFCDAVAYQKIVAKPTSENFEQLSIQIVALNALVNAIPSLDLVMTPNGFGIVSTDRIAPASKDRIDRLVNSLIIERDNAIQLFLHQSASYEEWKGSEQYRYFSATLFPNFDYINVSQEVTDRWAKYKEMRTAIIDIESSIAEEYFSYELMAELREEAILNEFKPLHGEICTEIRSQIMAALKTKTLNSTALMRIVNIIRHHPEQFEKWVNSPTAKLFGKPRFENKKESGGYFF